MGTRRRRISICVLTSIALWSAVPSSARVADRPSAPPTGLEAFEWTNDPVADLAEMQARFDESVRVVEEAERELRESVANELSAAEQIGHLDADIERLAVDEYMDVDSIHTDVAVLITEPNSGVQRRALITVVAGDRAEVLAQLREAKDQLLLARPEAEAAIEKARVHRGEMETQLQQLKDAQARAAAVGHRIEMGESIRSIGNGDKVSVRGIVVDSSIAANLAELLAAAEADGIILGGGGWRDPAAQRRLRRQNCPSANAPASSCRPPTAKPGQSLHEVGLAVDFTYNGTTIQSRSSPAFQWMAANAERYGFYNLPSEPWHWSVNGD